MIQWIALAVALDGSSKAGEAKEIANEANHNARSSSSLIIVRPVDLIEEPTGEVYKLFGFIPLSYTKKVLAKKNWGTFSIKKIDILNIEERSDEVGSKYCRLEISPYAKIKKYEQGEGYRTQIGIFIPGSIEEVAGVINGDNL